MKKAKKPVIAVIILLLLCIIGAPCTPATPKEVVQEGDFRLTISEPKIDFPDSITFSIEAESNADISEITLQYQVDKLSPLPVTSVAFPEFDPDTKVKTSWTWDMKQTGGLPPGAGMEYWWSIKDAEEDTIETTHKELSFDDGRHSWKSTTSGQITILWYKGSDSFVQSLMSSAGQALERLAEDTGAELEEEATLYIYADQQDLLGAMIYPQEWTGGVAYTEFSTIAIGISTGDLSWGKRTIAHELAHLVVHQIVFSGYGVDLPTWLDEGLAMYTEGDLTSTFTNTLQQAIDNDDLFTVKSLCSSFPADSQSAYLSYAQSYSIVEYLLEEQGGREKMTDLLDAFKQGSGYVEALDEVYGLDIEQLDTLWREYVGA